MTQVDAWRMVRKRALAAGIMAPIGNHSFRATGITAYLANGGALEHAQAMAAHESPRTTKLYDRTKERLTQDEASGLLCERAAGEASLGFVHGTDRDR
jgi:site-specific recombinase XerD